MWSHTINYINLKFILISLINIVYCAPERITSPNGSFFYFAYGSNLLAKRIHLKNPTAVFYGTAKLKDHRLDFNMYTKDWQGAASTIVEDNEEEVWGALWTIDSDKMSFLDQQEGVAKGWYFAKNVTVTTPDGQELVARTYQENQVPDKINTDLPLDRRPSSTYLQVIILGAIESRLPADYIGFLVSFPSNKQLATRTRREELGYPF